MRKYIDKTKTTNKHLKFYYYLFQFRFFLYWFMRIFFYHVVCLPIMYMYVDTPEEMKRTEEERQRKA